MQFLENRAGIDWLMHLMPIFNISNPAESRTTRSLFEAATTTLVLVPVKTLAAGEYADQKKETKKKSSI